VSDVRRLPFDQYQRYRLVAGLLEEVRGAGQISVLDVGGGTGLLRRFLPDARVALVDVVPGGEERAFVLGDGSHLPFADGSFDAVAAFDTLEHVPPARRADFVREAARVARRWVVLAGPYHTPAVRRAEEELDRFLEEHLSLEHAFLREHLANGLPEREEVERLLREAGGRTSAFGHGNLGLWQTLMRLEIALDEPVLRPFAGSLYELYARAVFERDRAEPVYRHAVVAAFGEAPLPAADGRPPAVPAVELEAALVRAFEQALELFAEDRERRAWLAERASFQQVVRDLEADLEGHRATLREVQGELEAHRQGLRAYEERVRELRRKTPSGRWRQLCDFVLRREPQD
jgi:SAM-dependent methyltransferase